MWPCNESNTWLDPEIDGDICVVAYVEVMPYVLQLYRHLEIIFIVADLLVMSLSNYWILEQIY